MSLETHDLVKSAGSISSLPTIFIRINDAVNNPRSSLADIGRVISEDPGLTARLLRIVNSAFYSFPSKIDTISRAVTIVGTQQLRDLALATSVMKVFKGIPEDLINMEAFWCHSIGCGITARVLASHRREANLERHFVTGMLHDIGRLLLFMNLPKQSRAALMRCQRSEELLYKVEREEIGFDHATVGSALLQAWNLPASLEEVVAFHHAPQKALRYPIETAIVHVADIITHTMELGSSGERLVPHLNSEAWEKVGLPASLLPATLGQVEKQFHDATQMILQDNKS
jgi:HD-like signal output (HDOD) protein